METLPIPLPHALSILYTGDKALKREGRELVTQFTARLALMGPVDVLDGSNAFRGYRLLQYLRRALDDPAPAAGRVFIRRAFTCYQMLALLSETPAAPHPHVVLDPLVTFYDEQLSRRDAVRLLEESLAQLRRIKQAAPVLLLLSPPPSNCSDERGFLVERTLASADRLYSLEEHAPAPTQLVLC